MIVALFRLRHNGTYILNKKEFVARIKNITGYRPGNVRIYEKAFIHRSASYTVENGNRINNERLEFLGDTVLDTIISEYFFSRFPEADEGELTKIRARLVNREVLNELAVKMGIDSLLISHLSKKNPGKNIFGDALEALVGSVFLDKGYRKTASFIIKNMFEKHVDIQDLLNTERDFKSQVYQWAQKLNRQVDIEHLEEFDKDTKQYLFKSVIRIDHEVFGTGEGPSKKESEQEASYGAYKKIQRSGFIDR